MDKQENYQLLISVNLLRNNVKGYKPFLFWIKYYGIIILGGVNENYCYLLFDAWQYRVCC